MSSFKNKLFFTCIFCMYCFIICAQSTHNEHEYVDLGLPSGLKWATTNVGSSVSYRSGNHYAWGELEVKNNYDYDTYKFADITNQKGYTKYNRRDKLTVLRPEDDIAHVSWGGNWRMPTRAECEELKTCCNWQSINLNGKNAIKVTGPNGQYIVFPLSGVYWGKNLMHSEKFGTIWCGNMNNDGSSPCQQLSFWWEKSGNCSAFIGNDNFILGMNVRAVFK